MVSRATIKTLVDESEAKYQECWETLSRLTKPKGTEGAELFEDMLEFQPTLARALYDLSEMHRTLHQEKQSVVAKKEHVSPEWFRHRMKLLDGYQKVIKATISIGKQLGDAFAWLFYGNETEHLREHYKQQAQFHAPPGIGGLGELKFIEDVRYIKGHLVLYHGITTFLRLGDISFINMDGLNLSAVGELKTTQIAEDQLSIMVTTVGQTKESVSLLVDANADKGKADDEPVPCLLPQNMRGRLDRQVASIGGSFDLPGPTDGLNVETDAHLDKLPTLCKGLKPSSFTFEKIGDGLLLMGIKTAKRSLASKLMTPIGSSWNNKMHGLEGEAQHLLDRESTENEIWFGGINVPTSEYQLTPGAVPLFWWPLDLDVIKAILFHEALVLSVYNPVHLVTKLRNAGFKAESLAGQRGIKVEKVIGDKTLVIENFDYFINLVTGHFFDEQAVVESLTSFSEKAESTGMPPYTKIEMQIQQHFGPKPA